MAIAKVVLNGTTKMDTTQVTVTAADLAQGVTALGADGMLITGTGSGDSTLITKTITENGTYAASSDNADGYSSVIVNVQGSGGALEPFDTYEFNVPADINYQDATGTGSRTLARWNWHQATLDKLAEYASITVSDHPFAVARCARILFSVVPKNPSAIVVPDATYIKNVRKDSCYFLKLSSGAPMREAPLWRAVWRLAVNGSFSYSGSFNASNDTTGFDVVVTNIATTKDLSVQTQMSQYSGQMISAGDYVVRLFDLTGTVL